ncbi:hypothetical protein PO909_026246 [Leuciscus waleckii]
MDPTSDTNLLRQKQITNKTASGIRDIRIKLSLKDIYFLQEMFPVHPQTSCRRSETQSRGWPAFL